MSGRSEPCLFSAPCQRVDPERLIYAAWISREPLRSPTPGRTLGLEPHEGADIRLMLLPPTPLAEPSLEHGHANHPYLPPGTLVPPGGDESMTICWQGYENAQEIRDLAVLGAAAS